jgi:hypothetical protein
MERLEDECRATLELAREGGGGSGAALADSGGERRD